MSRSALIYFLLAVITACAPEGKIPAPPQVVPVSTPAQKPATPPQAEPKPSPKSEEPSQAEECEPDRETGRRIVELQLDVNFLDASLDAAKRDLEEFAEENALLRAQLTDALNKCGH